MSRLEILILLFCPPLGIFYSAGQVGSVLAVPATQISSNTSSKGWFVSAVPSSIRINPVSGKPVEDRPDIYNMRSIGNVLEHNWVYDGEKVRLQGARGEYVSFQVVLPLVQALQF